MKIGGTHSIETKKKMSIAHSGNNSPCKGKPLSAEHKKKLSIAHIGKHHTEETKKKIGEGAKGRIFSDVCIQKRRAATTGKKRSAEFRNRMSQHVGVLNNRYGTRHTEETLKIMRDCKLGENNPHYGAKTIHSAETRQKISDATRGTRHPLYGKHLSNESKRKLRVATLAYIKKYRGNVGSNVGRHEKLLLDQQELIDNIIINRHHHIEYLGYIVDGFCPTTNTVYEVYEDHHKRCVQKDLNRETEICNYLGCDFVILWDILDTTRSHTGKCMTSFGVHPTVT